MGQVDVRTAPDRRARLREIVAELSFKQGDFTLTSGRSSGRGRACTFRYKHPQHRAGTGL